MNNNSTNFYKCSHLLHFLLQICSQIFFKCTNLLEAKTGMHAQYYSIIVQICIQNAMEKR